MRIKAVPIALVLVIAAAIPGCGAAGPKRAVDARTEVLRFFSPDAPAVALLLPYPIGEVVKLDQAADGSPVWLRLRRMVLGPLRAAGLPPAELGRLVRPSEEIQGVVSSALALGASTPADLASHRPLLVLATDHEDELSGLLRSAAERGLLQRIGQLDEAALYRGRGAAFAVRDGVLVSASNLAEVRTAIRRRDGDRDQQLDEDVVESLFNDLGTQGPLLVYANLVGVRESDPGLRALASQAPWTGMLGPTAATAQAVNGSLQIDDLSKTTGGDLSSAELPLGTAPTRFTITPATAASLIPHPGPIQMLLSGLGTLSGEATASSDEVRLHMSATP